MSEIDERVARLRDRAEHKAEAWNFTDKGPEFAGYFQYWTQGSTSYGPCPIGVFLGVDGGEWSVWCFHKVLAGELVKADPQNGELVLIRHLGKVEPDGGGPAYDNYRVVVERERGGGLPISRVAELAGVEYESEPSSTRLPADRPRRDEAPVGAGEWAPQDDDIPF